jgi:hypothetical protein
LRRLGPRSASAHLTARSNLVPVGPSVAQASVWWEFIPRMVFLMCTFGYMIFMILCTSFQACLIDDWTGSFVISLLFCTEHSFCLLVLKQ